jgi:hypothetical protein
MCLLLVFKQASYKLSGIFDVSTGSLLHLHDGPLHHRLKGDLGVADPESCQRILRHYLRQGAVLCLQLVVDDFLQL